MKAGRHLLEMINTIILYSKLEAGEHKLNTNAPNDIGEIINGVLRKLDEEVQARGRAHLC